MVAGVLLAFIIKIFFEHTELKNAAQRVNKALQTLKQYGPTEGLRKLKASDPEVATHFERLLRSKEDSTAKIHE